LGQVRDPPVPTELLGPKNEKEQQDSDESDHDDAEEAHVEDGGYVLLKISRER